MKPYYQDKLVTIYNCTSDIFQSDVVVLDPPQPMSNASIFKAETYYIFCGSKYEMYEQQFPDMKHIRVPYRLAIPGGGEKVIYTDLVLVVGNVLVPGLATYQLKSIDERYHKWERPLEFVLNLLGCSKGSILDPFMGSGVSLVAAKMMGRKAIGFDTDEKCCEIAAERCRNVK